MEFFERAHVVKKKSAPKESKAIKNQLKQMLRGYKQNNPTIIKDAGFESKDKEFYVDDSHSVSGFSDLSLTDASNDGDNTQNLSNISNIKNIAPRSSPPRSSRRVEKRENKNPMLKFMNDDEEDILSQPEVIPSSQENTQSSPENSQTSPDDNESVPEDNITTSSDSQNVPDVGMLDADNVSEVDENTNSNTNDSDEQFDADGALACKILERIKAKQNESGKKRKLDNSEAEDSSDHDDLEFTGSIMKQTRKFNLKCRKELKDSERATQKSDDEISDKESIEKLDTSTQDSTSTSMSAPYIAVTATDMPTQSLSDILGGYKYPTIKNVPSEKQNVVYSTKPAFVTSDNVENASIITEEETDSLLPEQGDEPTEQELDENVSISSAIPTDESIADDENEVIDDTSQEIQIDEPAPTDYLEQGIVNPIRRVFYGTNTCIFVLKHPTRIYIHGKVKAKALGGTIEVFGYTLNDKFSEIYAPNYNFAQCIKTVECQNVYYGLFSKLTASGLSVQDAEEIVTTIGEYDGVLSLSAMSNRKMDFVEENFTAADIFAKPSKYIDNCFRKASEMLGCSLYLTQPGRRFVENINWDQAITCALDEESRAIICGGKSTGKSTFLRYYINKLVPNGPVLLIDLDPGQAEMTVAGNVSATVVKKPLIGPNFTHLTKPDKMLNIGVINTMDNPTRYASAVLSIFKYCHSNENYNTLPWVVNTMGMCNNLGLKFLTLTILLARPTLLVKMDSKNQKKRFEIDLDPSSVQNFLYANKYDRLFKNIPYDENIEYTLITSSPIENKSKVETSLSAKEERYLNFLAYFGGLLDVNSGPGILGIVPYEVKLEDLNVGSNVNIRKDVVTKVINGKIIALCQQTTQDKGRVFNLRDNAVLCLGHGLVRGVDFDKGLLYIITPEPVDTLLHVNTLLYSDWVPDLKGQDKHLPDGTIIPYRTTSQQRQLMTTPHRRFNPLQLLKMSRKS